MSLIHWWQLNGDLKDYGTNPIDLTNSGATIDNNGKIGKCYSFDGTNDSLYYNGGPVVNGIFSITAWVKSNSNTRTQCIFCNRQVAGSGPALFIIDGKYLRFDTVNSNFSCPYPDDLKWHHIACVYNGSKRIIYIDGEYKNQTNTTSYGTTSNYVTIGGSGEGTYAGNNWMVGYVNDVRIYDHALSQKEVKEISKGLVLDYNFEDGNLTPYGNVYYGTDYTKGLVYVGGTGWTATGPFIDEVGDTYYTYKLSYTGTGSNFWQRLYATTFPFVIGDKYLYSCCVRVRECSNMDLSLRAARISNDWVASTIQIVNSSEADNTWRCKSVSTTIPETFDRSGTIVTSNPLWEVYSSNCNVSGTVYTCEFDIKKVSVINCRVHDNSGYGNNGTVIGSLNLTNDTIVGKYSMKFASNSYIDITNALPNMYSVTYAFWVKLSSSDTATYNSVFMVKNSPTSKIWICLNTENYSMWSFQGSNEPKYCRGGTWQNLLTLDKWYYCVNTFDNGVSKLYLDGVLIGQQTYTTRTYIESGNFTIGDSYTGSGWGGTPFKGYIADFKIYATALSADDIKLEYQRKASIDKNGNLFSPEFIEDNTNIKITNTQITKAGQFVEGNTKAQFKETYDDNSNVIHINQIKEV